ncbi:MAG: DNRLRE domain-containing protein, partial [Chloroflexi bacterium]|nr:DNRLRE domain-containing protein [Chloroflexota bacterium]
MVQSFRQAVESSFHRVCLVPRRRTPMKTTLRSWLGLTLVALLALLLATPAGGFNLAADAAPAAPGDTLTLYAAADATTKSWQPNANFGADTMLQLHYDNVEGPAAAFTLIHFDLSGIPPDAVIDSAVMELYLWNAAGADPVWIGLYDVYAAWNESTVTWNTRPPGQTGGFVYGVNVDAAPGYKSWAVTGWIDYWRNNPNYGLELRGPITGDPSYYDRNFASKDGRVNLPRLVVTYHLPATATATPTNTQIPNTPTPTATRTPTITRTPTPTATVTWTPTATWTPSVTASPMGTPTPTNTQYPISATPTPTRTRTRTPTNTSIPNTFTPTATRVTHTPTPSSTPTPTLPPGCPDLIVNGGFETGS